MTAPPRLLLAGGRAADGSPLDVAIDTASGVIAETAEALAPGPGDTVLDCTEMVVLAAPCEPHTHLDKALSGLIAPNPAGDLLGAITAWHARWPHLTHDDLVERATAAVEGMVLHGTTAIRSHADVGTGVDLRAVRALVAVRDDVRARGLADVQIVALVAAPLTGDDGREHRRLLEAALDDGVDIVGGVPYRDPAPEECTRLVLDVAARRGAPVDLHTDETLDPAVVEVRHLARMTAERGLGGSVTASHCVSLGVQPERVQQEVAAELAAAGVAVVALPQTNLYLQARDVRVAPPRGLTAVRALLDAGATLAAGADNVRDPFCAMGRMDALETAALLVMAAHLTPDVAWHCCTTAARRAMGLPDVWVGAGSPAELLVVEGETLTDAMARASDRRIVVHEGRVVATTTVERRVLGQPTALNTTRAALRPLAPQIPAPGNVPAPLR
ncbi:MAG TPA: amidohydrolase family protein [Acidimicrobiales bacterium]|nr:amidohydrolase family protein [Acidimicrobiales bacterium]